MRVKHVFLDHKGNEFTVTDEAYTKIEAIVRAHRLCRFCQKPFTADRPMVARNKCLPCYLRSHSHEGLHYTGQHHSGAPDSETYLFLDPQGYVYLSEASAEDSNSAYKSVCDTLLYWGFMVPETVTRNGTERRLDRSSWSIYGDFQHHPVIVVKYHEYYGDHLETAFFVYKDKLAVEVNKRQKAVQQLFRQARQQLEATRDGSGAYHIGNDWTTYHIEEGHLYPIISELLSQQLHIPKQG